MAEKVIWDCLVEEPTLFLRTFLEKLTHRNRQEELIFLMRKLLYNIQALPAQTAHSLFNYIVIIASLYFNLEPDIYVYINNVWTYGFQCHITQSKRHIAVDDLACIAGVYVGDNCLAHPFAR